MFFLSLFQHGTRKAIVLRLLRQLDVYGITTNIIFIIMFMSVAFNKLFYFVFRKTMPEIFDICGSAFFCPVSMGFVPFNILRPFMYIFIYTDVQWPKIETNLPMRRRPHTIIILYGSMCYDTQHISIYIIYSNYDM